MIVLIPDHGYQQGLARKAHVDEKLTFLQREYFAVALATGRIVPRVRDRSPMVDNRHRLDRVVILMVDVIQSVPRLLREINIRRRQNGLIALLRLAATKIHPTIRGGDDFTDGGEAGLRSVRPSLRPARDNTPQPENANGGNDRSRHRNHRNCGDFFGNPPFFEGDQHVDAAFRARYFKS